MDIVDDTPGSHTLTGSDGADSIQIYDGGPDLVYAGGGGDAVYGGAYADTVFGGDGADFLHGGVEQDGEIHGDAGNDTIVGVDEFLAAYGGADDDSIQGAYQAQVWGGDGNDTITDVQRADNPSGLVAYGGAGEDHITGTGHGDALDGGDGADWVYGGGPGFSVSGGEGDDHVGGQGMEAPQGLPDQTFAEGVYGGGGDDTVSGSPSPASDGDTYLLTVSGGDGNDLVYGSGEVDGDAGADTIYGGGTVHGGDGADVIYAGGGDDTLVGGAGADLLFGGKGTDTADYAASGAGVSINLGALILVGSGVGADYVAIGHGGDAEGDELHVKDNLTGSTADRIENLAGSGFADHLVGDDGANALYGGGGDDLLAGAGGNDTLDGGPGADTLQGGTGDDTFVVDDLRDVVFEKAGEGSDTVLTTLAAYTLGANVENLAYTGAGDFHGTGNTLANVITGGDGNDGLDGGKGADTVYGGAGDDTVTVDQGGDQVFGGDGLDTVIVLDSDFRPMEDGGVETLVAGGTAGIALYGTYNGDEHLIGNDAANHLYGVAGNDTLEGMGGNDVLQGQFEGNSTLYGGEGNDTISVGEGFNPTSGEPGYDLAHGGPGIDTLIIDFSGGTQPQMFVGPVTQDGEGFSGEFSDSLNGSGPDGDDGRYVDFAGIDRFDIRAGKGDHYIDLSFATEGQKVTTGTGGATVIGGMGADTISIGGGFADIPDDQLHPAFVQAFGHGSVVDLGVGASLSLDRSYVSTPITIDLSSGHSTIPGVSGVIDSLVDFRSGSGNDSIDASGGPLDYFDGGPDQKIDGGAGNDTIAVDIGYSTIVGGDGTDTLRIDLSGAYNPLSIVDGASGAGGLSGSVSEDTSYAGEPYSSGVDFSQVERLAITGGQSADDLDLSFAGGPVTLSGGAGGDTLVGGSGADVLTGAGGYISPYYPDGADSLEGGAGNDTLYGGAGKDTLDGGAGADLMVGGAGNDVYFVDDPGDRVVEQPTEGIDDIYTTLHVYTAPVNVEDVQYDTIGGTFNVTGNAGPNYLNSQGATTATLHGGDGADTLQGGNGDESLYGGAGNDAIYGGAGDDYIRTLSGDGVDSIDGGAGTDLLTLERLNATVALHIDVRLYNGNIGDGTQVQNIEQLRFAGGSGDDSVHGGDLDDVLKGSGGNDTLSGGGGNDVLQGGPGQDELAGGTGADTFRFDGPVPGSDDTVDDFATGQDHVALSKTGFGIATAADFDIVSAATGPTEAKATLVVDTVNHTIAWDADGTGSGSAVLLAHGAFTTNPADYVVF